MRKNAVVISPAWPSYNNGYGIAVQSSLRAYEQVFSSIHYIVLAETAKRRQHTLELGEHVQWSHVYVTRQAKWKRFVSSIHRGVPAVAIPFIQGSVVAEVIQLLECLNHSEDERVLIFEDIPPAVLLDLLRDQISNTPVIVRSHNVLTKAFEPFSQQGLQLSQVAWRIETSRQRRLELSVLRQADRFWAISTTDADEYFDRFGIKPHGVLGVGLDVNRYKNVSNGNILSLLYLGAADLRKGTGIQNFINHCWNDIRADFPHSQLLLAGHNTDSFSSARERIQGFGYYDDEEEFLSRGQIFINPQEIGSGVKLKSIVAMLAGKALVSTEVGVEGIDGENGKHFLVAKESKDLAPLVLELLHNPEKARRLGKQAQEHASAVYNMQTFLHQAQPLIEELAAL